MHVLTYSVPRQRYHAALGLPCELAASLNITLIGTCALASEAQINPISGPVDHTAVSTRRARIESDALLGIYRGVQAR